jgi:hypothetical protein
LINQSYVNGISIGTDTNSSDLGDVVSLSVGASNHDVNERLIGKVAIARIYKGRGLTAAEVLGNFNAVKARFGL